MQPDHEYTAVQLIPVLTMARAMEDKFVPYLIEMATEHCLSESKSRPSEEDRRLIKAANMR